MDVSREESEPDTSVDINFEAKPNSYIGVTGIDQSVLLLKSGNDITRVSLLLNSFVLKKRNRFLLMLMVIIIFRITCWMN